MHGKRREAFCYGRARSPSFFESDALRLLAVKFDDQLLVYRHVDVLTPRQRYYLAGKICVVHLQPTRRYLVTGEFRRGLEHRELLAALADLYLVAHTHLEGRNVHFAAIHFHMAVAHDLPRLAPRTGKTETEGDVIETPLELLQQQLAGDALAREAFS